MLHRSAFLLVACFLSVRSSNADAGGERLRPSLCRRKSLTPASPQGIMVRTTENVTNGGWVWILNQCQQRGITRIDLLMKQDEDNFKSRAHRPDFAERRIAGGVA